MFSIEEDISKISDGVYISSRSIFDNDVIPKYKISCLVILNSEVLDKERFPGVKTFSFQLEDSVFDETDEFCTLFRSGYNIYSLIKDVQTCSGNICFVCDYGIRRSPAVATAYFILAKKMSLPDALKLVVAGRGQKVDITEWYYRELEML